MAEVVGFNVECQPLFVLPELEESTAMDDATIAKRIEDLVKHFEEIQRRFPTLLKLHQAFPQLNTPAFTSRFVAMRK